MFLPCFNLWACGPRIRANQGQTRERKSKVKILWGKQQSKTIHKIDDLSAISWFFPELSFTLRGQTETAAVGPPPGRIYTYLYKLSKIVPKKRLVPAQVVQLCENISFPRCPTVLRACGTEAQASAGPGRGRKIRKIMKTTNWFPSMKNGPEPVFFLGQFHTLKFIYCKSKK